MLEGEQNCWFCFCGFCAQCHTFHGCLRILHTKASSYDAFTQWDQQKTTKKKKKNAYRMEKYGVVGHIRHILQTSNYELHWINKTGFSNMILRMTIQRLRSEFIYIYSRGISTKISTAFTMNEFLMCDRSIAVKVNTHTHNSFLSSQSTHWCELSSSQKGARKNEIFHWNLTTRCITAARAHILPNAVHAICIELQCTCLISKCKYLINTRWYMVYLYKCDLFVYWKRLLNVDSFDSYACIAEMC